MTYSMRAEQDDVEGRVGNTEKRLLRAHIRDAHRNLLGPGPHHRVGFSPLPESGISDVPFMWLHAIHETAHAEPYRDHVVDDWREQP